MLPSLLLLKKFQGFGDLGAKNCKWSPKYIFIMNLLSHCYYFYVDWFKSTHCTNDNVSLKYFLVVVELLIPQSCWGPDLFEEVKDWEGWTLDMDTL